MVVETFLLMFIIWLVFFKKAPKKGPSTELTKAEVSGDVEPCYAVPLSALRGVDPRLASTRAGSSVRSSPRLPASTLPRRSLLASQVDQLVDEWEPAPLVPKLTEAEQALTDR